MGEEPPAGCQSACCSPIARPPLKQNPATSQSASSSKSMYSTGTDGSTLQSEDGSAGAPDFGDNIDSITFEQASLSAPPVPPTKAAGALG